MINLMNLEPHKISRDLSGYITYIYGAPKIGKTTLGSQMPKPLILAFERGYNALAGVYVQDITSWSEMKQVVKELKKPEIKEKFTTIVVDTVDIAATCCEKFICGREGVNAIGEIPYGQGWSMLKKEFEDVFRTISQAGYAVCCIAHYKEGVFKLQDGTEYSIIRPSVSDTYNKIIENMADIYAYMYADNTDGNNTRKMVLRSKDGSIACGCRFKYIVNEVNADYDSLVKALNDAIDEEAKQKGNQYVTNDKLITDSRELDFDEVKNKFDSIVSKIITSHSEEEMNNVWGPKINQITEKYLGKNKKASQCTRDQVEQLNLIVSDLEELIK